MGVQIILCGVMAYLLRVNIPLALAGSLVTNPFTAAVVYPLEYKVGVWLIGPPTPSELEEYSGALRTFVGYAKPLWVGSMAIGVVAAAVAYVLVMLLWREAEHLRDVIHRKHAHPPADDDSTRQSVPPSKRESLSTPDAPTKEHTQ